jgi:formylglycine-generating enzyme required for sulfatase activity
MKLPNAWGLFDTYGNVDEWCWDWYTQQSPPKGTDPQGPKTGTARTLRGGSFLSTQTMFLSSDNRPRGLEPTEHRPNVGIRVVFTAAPPNPPADKR